MSIITALVLGIVQGITEFLPISSTGHLILVPYIFHWEIPSLSFDAILHLGTLFAIVIFFWRDWIKIILSLWSDLKHKNWRFAQMKFESRLGILILIGCLPAASLGLIFQSYIESTFRSPLSVATSLILVALLMFWVEKKGQVLNPLKKFKPLNARTVGAFQSLALVPGVSRSGITILGGMLSGLTRQEAARFSFLLATPVILGAGLESLLTAVKTEGVGFFSIPLVVGLLASSATGFLTIRFLLNYLKEKTLLIFAVYRILLAALILILFFAR